MKPTNQKPLFITFEGSEGSGKSTQAKMLHTMLCKLNIACILIHEPGCTPLGEKLANLLKRTGATDISPLSELLLFNAARTQLVNDVIQPSLKKGKTVICDRYTDSTLAYQGYGRRLNLKTVAAINEIATGGLRPDLTILLDMPINKGLMRKRDSNTDRFESEELSFHKRIRQGYLSMARNEPERFFIVDGQKDKKTISIAIWNRVTEILKIKCE